MTAGLSKSPLSRRTSDQATLRMELSPETSASDQKSAIVGQKAPDVGVFAFHLGESATKRPHCWLTKTMVFDGLPKMLGKDSTGTKQAEKGSFHCCAPMGKATLPANLNDSAEKAKAH